MGIDLVTDEEVDDFFEHYGIKGQRWGVRKGVKGPSFRTSSDFKETVGLRGKNPSSLTNKQLKAVNERINLEQNYKRLNPSKTTKGKSHAKEILATVGIGVGVLNLVNSPIGKALISNGKKVMEARKMVKVVKLLSTSGPGG